MTRSERLYDEAVAAVAALFSDTSVSRAKTKRLLGDLIEEIEEQMDTLSDVDADADDDE